MNPRLLHPAKFRLLIFSTLLALLLAYLFLIPSNPGNYRAVPPQTSVLIEFNGLVKAAKEHNQTEDTTWKELLKSTLFKQVWQGISHIAPLFEHVPALKNAFSRNSLLAAYSLHSTDSLNALFILDVKTGFNLEKALKTNLLSAKFFPYQFKGQTLYTVHLSKDARYVCAPKGHLLVFARYSYLVEDALTQMESARGWWADNKYFSDLNPGASTRIFFRPAKWQAQQGQYLHAPAQGLATCLSENIAWAGIALDGKNLTAACEPMGFLAKLGSWNAVGRTGITSFLPDHTALVAWAGFDNRSRFFQQFSTGSNSDFLRYVLPWIGQEVALVVTEPLSVAALDDRLFIVSVKDSSQAMRNLEEYGKSRGLLSREKIGMFEVFGFQSSALWAPFLASPDPTFQHPYFAQLGDYAVVAPNRPAMEIYLEKYINNQTLAQNTDFLQLVQQMKPKGRGSFLLNTGYLPKLMQYLFQEGSVSKQLAKDIQQGSKVGWIAADLQPKPGKTIPVGLYAQKAAIALPVSNVHWKTALHAPAVTNVYRVPQPAMEIGTALLVQDRDTRLYSLDPKGNIIWQKRLGSLIISPIQGIDFYQNDRNCYIFNTKSQVWILDENGKEVQGYPLQLKAQATVGLSLVPFDRGGNHGYFISCDNGHSYGFDLYGRAIDGWNPQSSTGKAAGSPLHFQHAGKDYLALLSTDGRLSVFGRDGKPRFNPITLPGEFSSSPFVEQIGGKPRIVCINSAGGLFEVDANGRLSQKQLPGTTFSKSAKIRQSNLSGAYVYALLHGKQLQVFNRVNGNTKTVFAQQFTVNQDDVFFLDNALGLCAKNSHLITLLNQKGEKIAGFPIAGSTGFTNCQMGKEAILVSGNGSAVYAYKLENHW